MDEDMELDWIGIEKELYTGGSEWRNIQKPIVSTFDAVSRGVRNIRAKLYEMDRQTHASIGRADTRTSMLEDKVERLCTNLEKLTAVVEAQNEKFDDVQHGFETITRRVDEIALRLDAARMQQSDVLYDRIQDQIAALNKDSSDHREEIDTHDAKLAEVNRQLSLKASQREIDEEIPFKIEEVARKMQLQVNEVRSDLNHRATKDELANLSTQKASAHDMRALALEQTERVTRVELADSLNEQMRPVVAAIASLEKAMQFVEEGSKAAREDVEILRPICASAAASADAARLGLKNAKRMDEGTVVHIVEKLLGEKQLDVTSLGLQNSLSEYREVLLKDVSSFLEASKLDLRSLYEEKNEALRTVVDKRVMELAVSVKEAKESAGRTKNGVKELANNVAKALSQKAEKDEMKRFLDAQAEHDASTAAASTAAAVHAASALVYGGGRRPNVPSDLQHLSELPVRDPHFNKAASSSAPVGERLSRVLDDYASLRAEVSTLGRANKQVRAELLHVQRLVTDMREAATEAGSTAPSTREQRRSSSSAATHGSSSSGGGHGKSDEWRQALGEVNAALRRQMAENARAGVQEVTDVLEGVSAVQDEVKALKVEVEDTAQKIADVEDVRQLLAATQAKVDDLQEQHRNLAIDSQGGIRLLWTSGQREADGWIPWDTEAQNSNPTGILWSPGSYSIRARTPGLYRICVAVFTTIPLALQVCLNWEPLLSLQPPHVSNSDSPGSGVAGARRDVVRSQHAAGEVTCVCIDEYISIPAESVVAVRYHAAAPAQAMFTLRKL